MNCFPQSLMANPEGPLKYIGVNTHVQINMWKGVFFTVECVMQGTGLGVKIQFKKKKMGGVVKIYSNSLDSKTR